MDPLQQFTPLHPDRAPIAAPTPAQTPTSTLPPTEAGWYPDPASTEHLRWWDGREWLDETKPPGGPTAAAVPLEAGPSERPTRVTLPEGQARLETGVFTCDPPRGADIRGLVTTTVVHRLDTLGPAGGVVTADDDIAQGVADLRVRAQAFDADQVFALRVTAAPMSDGLMLVLTGTAVAAG